ncbi:hypothetical protein Afil01_18660 [Actinorhabdospora filicis]|uniref:Lipoprotein n=1 Tax=Actinorhabdospora filicis TaxID=1785913 RepID=A0A9W6W7Z4_9ACTN|nr:hypothetical protein Afil01_18660 [Actinorhabdospora filicis]
MLIVALLALVGMAGCGPVVAFQEPRQPVFAAEDVFPDDFAPQVAANAAGPVTEVLAMDERTQEEGCPAFRATFDNEQACDRTLGARYYTTDRKLMVSVQMIILPDSETVSGYNNVFSGEYLHKGFMQVSGGSVGRYGLAVGVYDGSRGSRPGKQVEQLTGELAERARALAHGTRVFLEDSIKQRVGL